jgi:hypothetical protein
MGLKTNYYESKSTGVTIFNAYAVLGDLVVNRHSNSARAVFLVQANREYTHTYKPLDEVTVHFTWDRKTDPAKQAYEAAKMQMVYVYKEDVSEPVEEKGVLFGWYDDIV